MGMPDAFDRERADFSGMDGMKYPDGLYIKDMFHQADIEVSEEGTTASGATAVVMALRGLPREFEFNANHPFLFLLRENVTGSILFIGRVQNPVG
jgi:serpin B